MAGKVYEIAFRLAGKLSSNFTSSFKTVAGNLQKTNQNISKLKQELKGLEAAQRKGSIASEEYAQKQKRISDELEKQQKRQQTLAHHIGAKEANQKQQDKYGNLALKTAAIGAAVFGVPIAQAIEFESAMAGVKKTVDGTPEQLLAIENGIKKMSKQIPLGTSEIAALAEAAGQLGIETDNVLGFSRVMADLGVTTNLTGEEAASSLAKFANITGMSQANFDRLGSVIVALGNNLATTEADIVNMSMRLAGAGKQIGLTEAQIMSLAGAASSVGIEAEAGGSAFSKVMINMQLAVETGNESLADFARVAGLSAGDFQKAFKQDAMGAMVLFIEGLANAGNKGESAIKMLDDMGISEVRMRDALLRAAGASGVFASSIELGTQAWEENVALTNEAQQRYKTTASAIQLTKNRLSDIAMTVGAVLLPPLNNFLGTLSTGADKISAFAEKYPTLTKYVAGGAAAVIGLTFAFAALGYVIAFAKGGLLNICGLFLKQGEVATVATVRTKLWAAAQRLLNLAMSANPIGILIRAVALLAVGGYLLYRNWDKVRAFFTKLWDSPITKVLMFTTGPIGLLVGASIALIANWDKVKSFFIRLWNDPKKTMAMFVIDAKAKIAELWTAFEQRFPLIAKIVKFYVGSVVSFWTGAWDRLVAIYNGTMEFIKALMNGDFEKCGEIVGRFIGKVVKWFSGLPDKIENELTWLNNTITSFFDRLPDMARNGFDSLVTLAKSKFANLLPEWMNKGGVPPGAVAAAGSLAAPAAQKAPAQLSGWEKFKQGVSKGYQLEVSQNATGGIYNKGPFLTTFAENSKEAAIPIDGSKRAISLWHTTGKMLGMFNKPAAALGAPMQAADTTHISKIFNIQNMLSAPASSPFQAIADAPRNSDSSFVFQSAPVSIVIQGNADNQVVQQIEGKIQQAMQSLKSDFKRQFDAYQREQRRLAYD